MTAFTVRNQQIGSPTPDEPLSSKATPQTWDKIPRRRELRQFFEQEKERDDAIGEFIRKARRGLRERRGSRAVGRRIFAFSGSL